MKIAIVGSNRGIGLELVRQLTRDGHQVYAFCRIACDALRGIQPHAIIENFDVTRPDAMQAALARYPITDLDWLIHVSGLLKSASLENFNTETILEQFTVNAIGPILTVKLLLPCLAPSAKVALLTSRMGSIADNTSGGSYGYRMSKSALNSAGKSLSRDLKHRGIAVFLLHPGFVKTQMTGYNGHIDVTTSAQGLIRLMHQKTLADTGTFWHVNGDPLPW